MKIQIIRNVIARLGMAAGGRRGVTISEVVNLNDIISTYMQTPDFHEPKAGHPDVGFRIELDPELLNMKGSPVHLSKSVMNLIGNALEAISGPGEVVIRTENRYLDTPTRGYAEVKEGEYCVLQISDTGKGISPVDVSGFSETERVNEAQALGAGPYVRKPYLMEKIGQAIRDELDRR